MFLKHQPTLSEADQTQGVGEGASNTRWLFPPFVEMACSTFEIRTFSRSKDVWISIANAPLYSSM